MTTRFFAILTAPYYYFSLLNDLRIQNEFNKKYLRPELAELRSNHDGSLEEKDFKKIEKYYGLIVPGVLGIFFSTLRGSSMTFKERKLATFLGAAIGLFDDYFDKKKFPEDLFGLIQNPDEWHAENSFSSLSLKLYKAFLDNATETDYIKSSLKELYTVQLESKKQENPGIDAEELKQITLKKSGPALLFCRRVMFGDLRDGEYDALYQLGVLAQIGNDIFDAYKDSQSGIQTLATGAIPMASLKELFLEQLNKTVSLCMLMDYDKNNIRKALNKILIGLSSCLVCIDQLEALELKSGGKFLPANYSRKEMVCDMEKPGNLLKAAGYYAMYKI